MNDIIAVRRQATLARVRRHRQRRRDSMRCVTVEIRDREIDALVRYGQLDADKRDDYDAILLALYRFFDTTLGL